MEEILSDKEESSPFSSNKAIIDSDIQNEEESTLNTNLFDNDLNSYNQMYIQSNSGIKKFLLRILNLFYIYPILIILFSFLIGLLIFGSSMLLIYFKVFENIIIPIIILILFSLFFSVIIIFVHIIDNKKNKIKIAEKWVRKSILKNFGLSLTLIILTFASLFLKSFFNNILIYKDKKKLDLIYENNNNISLNNKINYFILKYIINCFLLIQNKITNEKIKVRYIIEKTILTELHYKLLIAFIPILFFSINKIIKTIIIEVKYTIPKLIVFINSFCLCILIFISYFFYNEENNFSLLIISFIEITILSLIYFGYFYWIFDSAYKLMKNSKDKNFGIYRYDIKVILIIIIFNLIDIFGLNLIYISLLKSFYNYKNENEIFHDLIINLSFLKMGFLFCTISNSYYYGYHLLSLIFRPISMEYTPAQLKENYIKVNRNLNLYKFF